MAESEVKQPSTSNNQTIRKTQKLVSLPKICLTRIDEKSLPKMPSRSSLKKPVKRLSALGKKVQNLSKPISKKSSPGEILKRSRGRPKKETTELPPTKSSKNTLNKIGTKAKKVTSKSVLRNPTKSQKISNNVSKKLLLQAKSKIVIPSARNKKLGEQKVKQSPTAQKKIVSKPVTQTKPAPPKPKLKVLPTKQESSDTSEDEFLYEELIEELENNRHKQVGVKTSISEKKTNITLKSNTGNKPPIIVKGGIVKRTDLPADLKSVASPKIPVKSNYTEKEVNTTLLLAEGKKRNSGNLQCPEPAKKPSPWPISISPQKKADTVNKISKMPTSKLIKSPITSENITKAHQKSSTMSGLSLNEPVTVEAVTKKTGPKQTAKVIPISKFLEQDENVSDEYLEEERLECDFESTELSKKAKQVRKEQTKPVKSATSTEDDDPNIDLLRILTDDSDELMPLETNVKTDKFVNLNTVLESSTEKVALKVTEENYLQVEKPTQDVTADEPANKAEEEPPVRTIYDLMNEVALQYPSWNLHIIPENSAFCIAQVTKGRLGLPTLKKCIELDPVHYNAKVYIHQYHIKRFDGVYDSEESILALIHEINNIKA